MPSQCAGSKAPWKRAGWLQKPACCLDDLSKATGQLEIAEFMRGEPLEVVVFLVEDRFPRRPACGKGHNQVVPGAACSRQHLAPAGKSYNLDAKRGLLVDLAVQGRVQGFSELDAATRQRIEAPGRRARAPHQEDLAVAEDRGADRELGTCGRG